MVRVCAVCCERVGFRNDEQNRIYTRDAKTPFVRVSPEICVFVVPLTFRRFALGSAGQVQAL